jgi:sec-independent protein translocase protein TatA
MPGMGELLIILAIVVVIFGAGKLPAAGDALGRTLRNFKRGVGGKDELEVGTDRSLASGEASGGKSPDGDA